MSSILFSELFLMKKLNSFYLSEVNTRVLCTIVLYDIGTINSPVSINYTVFFTVNRMGLFAILLFSGRPSPIYDSTRRVVSKPVYNVKSLTGQERVIGG